MEIPSTELQNNFGTYLKLAQFEDIIVTRNEVKVAVIKAYNVSNSSSVAETSGDYAWEKEKISYENFLKLAEASEKRYEYIDGEVYMLTSPTFDHQSIILEIANIMYNYFKGKKCRPLTAPFDVTLTVDNKKYVVQPDIIVICDTENINEKRKYTGVPTLIVEVLSESSQKTDMIKKLNLYLHAGVQEYWIVSPWRKEFYSYAFAGQDIKDYRTYKDGEIVRSTVFEELEIHIKSVFISS